jgi:nitroimidazol reductase NimA-like FMN-containing flavoprotein (pyridoxamine 5'-phosphate oxidase superfamily)
MEKNSLQSPRIKVKRAPQRGLYDKAAIYEVLDAAYLANIGFNYEDQPFVIPTLYSRLDDCLYIYGAASSRMIKAIINHPIYLRNS